MLYLLILIELFIRYQTTNNKKVIDNLGIF